MIDGEGYIGIRLNKAKGKLSASVELSIAMVDKGLPALQRMSDRYGGNITPHKAGRGKNYREAWRWAVTGRRASDVLTEVFPDLIVKRDVANIALQLQKMIDSAERRPNGNAIWTQEMKDSAVVYADRIKEKNRRGPDPNYPDSPVIAAYHAGDWWEPNDDLFGPVRFHGKFPKSGRMVSGKVFERPTLVPHTTGPGSSSSPTLPTPAASDGNGGKAGKHVGGFRPSGTKRSVQLTDLPKLLPTPVASDGEKERNNPAQARRKSPPLSAVNHLLPQTSAPTPKPSNGGNT